MFTQKLSVILRLAKRSQCSISSFPDHKSLVIESLGEPVDNLKLKTRRPEEILPKELGPKQVLVEHLAACINPSDISQIRGIYGIRPTLPAIAGNEGVTRVKSVGPEVTHLNPGDLAIGVSLQGYWQSYSIQNDQDLYKVDDDLDIATAAQLKVNPCTAYQMIKECDTLRPGDTIIQNGANSAVGVYVIQLAKLWGYKTINVIRNRPNREEVVNELIGFGADHVITEEELEDTKVMSPILESTGKPKLLLDCVAGKNAVNCQRLLDNGGCWLVYGGMSGRPFGPLSLASIIFKQRRILVVGFWMSAWYKEREKSRREEISALLNDVGSMFKHGILKPKPATLINFEDRNIAFSGSNNTKYIFSINK